MLRGRCSIFYHCEPCPGAPSEDCTLATSIGCSSLLPRTGGLGGGTSALERGGEQGAGPRLYCGSVRGSYRSRLTISSPAAAPLRKCWRKRESIRGKLWMLPYRLETALGRLGTCPSLVQAQSLLTTTLSRVSRSLLISSQSLTCTRQELFPGPEAQANSAKLSLLVPRQSKQPVPSAATSLLCASLVRLPVPATGRSYVEKSKRKACI